jgi:hypothetical protein
MKRLQAAAIVSTLFLSGLVSACGGNAAGPEEAPLATGRWVGDGACLLVTDSGCNLIVGCGHGQFPRPTLRADGTFTVEGTYRIEVGPISIEPAPPAQFSGSVIGSRMMLHVVPTTASLPPASYSMTPTTVGTCGIQCL